MSERASRPGSAGPPWALWILLTLLAVALFAPDRGLYQDDASLMAASKEAWKDAGLPALVAPMGMETRRLLGLPYLAAWATPEPALALQLLYALAWLAAGRAAWGLARALFPGDARAPWLAGALALTATGDYLTASPVALGYLACVILGLVALAAAVRHLRDGRAASLAAGCAAAAASVFTADGAAVALALAPLLFLAVAGPTRRAWAACAAWAAALAPYGLLLARALRDPATYVASARAPLTLPMRLEETARMTLNDVLPPMWVFARRTFGDRPPHAVAVWMWAAAGALAAWAVLRALGRTSGEAAGARGRRESLAAAWCALAAVASHAAYAGVAFSPLFYRTHVLSGPLVSVALALVAARLLARGGAGRAAGLALVAVFTGFGAAGGMERQDLYLATWRRHRLELASLVEEVPRARPGTTLLLSVPHDPAYQATEAPYLARRWSELLWEAGETRPRTFLWSVDAHTACVADAHGFRCRKPEERECFEAGACPGLRLRWEEIVLLTWRSGEGRFRLEDEVPVSLIAALPPPAGRYRPRDRILPGPPDPRAAAFLRGDLGLARFLP